MIRGKGCDEDRRDVCITNKQTQDAGRRTGRKLITQGFDARAGAWIGKDEREACDGTVDTSKQSRLGTTQTQQEREKRETEGKGTVTDAMRPDQ